MTHEFYLFLLPLIIGFLLDFIFGDPYHWPHPIRWFGNEIAWIEKRWNTGKYKQWKGIALGGFLIGQVWLLFFAIQQLLLPYPLLYIPVHAVFVFYGLANRSLIIEVIKVEKALQTGGVEAGRKQVQMIVGRDTSQLSANQVRTAALETLAENLSDGVVAPLFFYALGGVPAMMAFKMLSTLDSMVGYKSEKYKEFGWFSARLDDVANFLPARLTAFLMALLSLEKRAFSFILRYGNKHASPNAGYPEAALAGILNCRFGGPNYYHGVLVNKPYIGKVASTLSTSDIKIGCRINLSVSIAVLALIVFVYAGLAFYGG